MCIENIQVGAAVPRTFRRTMGHALVSIMLVASAMPAGAESLSPTPAQTEGPFYPRALPADRDTDLISISGHGGRAQGTVLYFTGRVLRADGSPVAGATVELWQADRFGRYHYAGDDGQPRDDDFQGYGAATTDGDGRFAFRTIRPVPYGGRPPHLHLKITAAGHPGLTTQLYIAGDRTDGDVVLADSPRGTLERLSMTLSPADGREPGAMKGSFDVVLQ